MSIRPSDTGWIKAARSGDEGACVEMRRHAGAVQVRDSKDPHGPVLRFTASEFAAWLDGRQEGRVRPPHSALRNRSSVGWP